MSGEAHGSEARIYAAGYDISPYLQSASGDESIDTAEVSGFSDGAKRYIAGLQDATVSLEGTYSSDTDGVVDALRTALGATAKPVCVMAEGDAIGDEGDGLAGIKTSRSVSSEIADAVKLSAELQSTTGLETIVSLHAMGEETADGNFASVDNGASSSDGAVGYLQVPEAAVSADVKIQHSPDDATWVDLIAFDQVTANLQAQRKTVTGTVDRYTRATVALGVGGSARFFAGVGRQPANT